jgi:hypothetical protein
MITYDQARADHEYLWSIGPAYDMTGGYVDQDDLVKLLEKPTKATARSCYCSQISYWFEVGPDGETNSLTSNLEGIPWDDPMVQEIAERHGHI